MMLDDNKFIKDMLKAGCYFDPQDRHKLIIPENLAARIGEKPGYFYINDPVDGLAIVERFNSDGSSKEGVM